MLSDEWLSRYGLLENFNASVTRTRTRTGTRTGTGTGTWTTGVTAIALCTLCSRANDKKTYVQRPYYEGYRYHKLRKTFSKFYRRHYELISKYNVGLKTLLSEGLSEPEFYGDLVYKLKKLKGINDFSLQFGKIISRYRRIGYNLNVMRQSACLVFNPIMVDNYAAFFNCTPVGRASDSMMAPT